MDLSGSGFSVNSSISCSPTCVPSYEDNDDIPTLIIALICSIIVIILLIIICICLFACFLRKVFDRPVAARSKNRRYSSHKHEDVDHSNTTHNPLHQATLLLPKQTSRALITFSDVSTQEKKTRKISHEDLTTFSPKQRLQILEFPHSNICLLGEMYESNFGKVYRGEALRLTEIETSTAVWIKSLKECADEKLLETFNMELFLVSGFDHPNIIKILAASTLEEPRYIVYEYLEFGSLKDFLQSTAALWLDMEVESTFASVTDLETNTMASSHVQQLVGTEELVAIAVQVSEGMEYLAKKGFIHKDLAARNCQVGEGLRVKIANFGLSYILESDDYCQLNNEALNKSIIPLRWLAPETLHDSQYSMFSDIWSYGVLLWEVFSFGAVPYTGLSNAEVIEAILSGQVMSRPEHCPKSVFKIMWQCWEGMPTNRPKFDSIKRQLGNCVKQFDLETVSRRFSTFKPSTPDLLRK